MEFEKSEQERENGSLMENPERYKEEQQEKEIVVIEKSEEILYVCRNFGGKTWKMKGRWTTTHMEFSPTCLHPKINERKETYHGVQRPRRKHWRKTILMLWRFVNEFFFKPIPLLPYVFLQRVEIILRWKFLSEEEFGKSWDSKSKQSYTFLDEFLDFMSKSSWEKGLGTCLRTNPFKGEVDGMTQSRHENMESFQASITRQWARKIHLEMQRNNLEEFEATEARPTIYPTVASRLPSTLLLPIRFCSKNYFETMTYQRRINKAYGSLTYSPNSQGPRFPSNTNYRSWNLKEEIGFGIRIKTLEWKVQGFLVQDLTREITNLQGRNRNPRTLSSLSQD
ncbi:hypothetical protein M9H77_02420 [Catharanthus roseus]|uniref:Uncharacterized protein n=1 Tax=Catharanthus roseus TaxID=4058 RepID=A0ACC0C8V6_CATRO|nr:hypothetical protein M9H77_02420 [Catharanthus roseus]